MSTILCARRNAFKSLQTLSSQQCTRLLATSADLSTTTPNNTPPPVQQRQQQGPNTHYKITLRRSAISLGDRKKGTLKALGLHRRMQTVYHRHSPDIAGKILAVKELVEVDNVPEGSVKTREQQTLERKAPRGYVKVGTKKIDL